MGPCAGGVIFKILVFFLGGSINCVALAYDFAKIFKVCVGKITIFGFRVPTSSDNPCTRKHKSLLKSNMDTFKQKTCVINDLLTKIFLLVRTLHHCI